MVEIANARAVEGLVRQGSSLEEERRKPKLTGFKIPTEEAVESQEAIMISNTRDSRRYSRVFGTARSYCDVALLAGERLLSEKAKEELFIIQFTAAKIL